MLHLPSRLAAEPAAAHAAAHWRFGGAPQPRAGLKAVQLALFGVLEDARIEALALRELPGLRALWLPFHVAGAPQGNHFEALLARLARSLLDPAHRDPHPWVQRARLAFRAAEADMHTTADVRRLASGLGNDIGQMRLPFHPQTYVVHAAYRDDNHHLWEEDTSLPPSEQALAAAADGTAGADARQVPAAQLATASYPEWDHRIGRYRRDWVQVFEYDAAMAHAAADNGDASALQRRLAQALARSDGKRRRPAGRAAWGEDFHAAALVEARVHQRLRRPLDERLYRRVASASVPRAALLLVDASASTGSAGGAGAPLLRQLVAVAQASAAALEGAGHPSAVLAFRSRGRHAVELLRIKHWEESAGAVAVRARCAALVAGGSTRTGAAVRHATAAMLARGPADGRQARLLLLTDGEPHDIDVHDPRYLAADFARASSEARAQGVTVRSLPLAALAQRQALPAALARLLLA